MGKDWVKSRAKCAPEDTLHDLIGQLKQDIQEYNQLGSEKRQKRKVESDLVDETFTVRCKVEVTNHRGTYTIDDENRISDVVKVKWTGTSIRACRNGRMHMEITPRWNSASQKCDLVVDENVHDIWQISEMILGDFMFER